MTNRQNRILVLGYFGYITNKLDGQTVKTRSIYNLVKNRSNSEISYADTQEFRHSFKSIIKFFRNAIHCDTLIWLPAHNNLKYLFPVLWLMSKIFKFDIIYIVIGGWLSQFLAGKSFHINKLKTIKAILLENTLAVRELQSKYNFNNLDIIPNFREIAPKPSTEVQNTNLRLVFMARVNKMKGLDTIAQVAEKLDNRKITIDFYGPIQDEDVRYFNKELIEKYSSMKYCGILQPSEIYNTLIHYDVMLFPTHYFTEGFPGSIMDAYRSGLPVIATHWKHATEFVENGVSGYIVDFNSPAEEIVKAIIRLDNDRGLLKSMKDNAYQASLKYTPDKAWNVLRKYL